MKPEYKITRDDLNQTNVYVAPTGSRFYEQGDRTEYTEVAEENQSDYLKSEQGFKNIIGRPNTELVDIAGDSPLTKFLQSTARFGRNEPNLIHKQESEQGRSRVLDGGARVGGACDTLCAWQREKF
jgi:hypothetical protein